MFANGLKPTNKKENLKFKWDKTKNLVFSPVLFCLLPSFLLLLRSALLPVSKLAAGPLLPPSAAAVDQLLLPSAPPSSGGESDDLTWEMVADAAGVEEDAYNTRRGLGNRGGGGGRVGHGGQRVINLSQGASSSRAKDRGKSRAFIDEDEVEEEIEIGEEDDDDLVDDEYDYGNGDDDGDDDIIDLD